MVKKPNDFIVFADPTPSSKLFFYLTNQLNKSKNSKIPSNQPVLCIIFKRQISNQIKKPPNQKQNWLDGFGQIDRFNQMV